MDLCQVAQEERAHEIYKFEIARQKETRTSPFVDPTSGNRSKSLRNTQLYIDTVLLSSDSC